MPTSVINSQVVLILRLICHDERVYEEIILCKTSLSMKVNCIITGLVQNLPKAIITLLPRKIVPMGFFPSFTFQFHSSYLNKKPTDVSAFKNSFQEMQPSRKI